MKDQRGNCWVPLLAFPAVPEAAKALLDKPAVAPDGAVPRLTVAGTASGVGKTSLALGSSARWCGRVCGCKRSRSAPISSTPRIRPGFRPDLLQPRRLDDLARVRAAAFRPRGRRRRPGGDRRRMGLFDGASPDALEGSTAEIASLLAAPILLVVNAHGAARSLAATVKGFAEFEPGLSVAGVIANQSGSSRHAAWLSEALASAALLLLLGRDACAGRCPPCKAGTWAWRPPTKPFSTRRRSMPWPTRAKNISTCRGCWRSPAGTWSASARKARCKRSPSPSGRGQG